MRRLLGNLWFRYLLLILWMALIYRASATPDLKSVPLLQRFHLLPSLLGPAAADVAELLIRKSAHAISYAVLAVLGRWAFGWDKPGVSAARLSGAAWGVAVLYACTDEYHQTFVAGREGRVTDIAIDAAGAAMGLLISLYASGRMRRGEGDFRRGRVDRA